MPETPLLLQRLGRKPRSPHRRRPAAAARAAADDRADDAPPPGCGWYDSSRDLEQGLVVREHAGAATLGTELTLADWLQLALRAA